jgi:hypothetical protein
MRMRKMEKVDRQHHGIGGWIEVEPDDIDDLLGKFRIIRQLERARQVRLQAMVSPHALYRRVANAELFGQRGRAPVRRIRWLLLCGPPDDLDRAASRR